MIDPITEQQMRSDLALWAATTDYRWIKRQVGTTPTDLIVEFAELHGTTLSALRSPKRKRPLVYRRQECMAMLKEKTDLNKSQIGRLLFRDASTVRHSIAAVKRRAAEASAIR